MINIVIAHYNEDLQWIKNLDSNNIGKIFIYSKYQDNQQNRGVRQINTNSNFSSLEYFQQLSDKVIIKKIPNVGRESETYLRYCVEEYDNLNTTIFLQGNPLDHINMNEINNWINDLNTNKYSYTQNLTNINLYSNFSFDGGHLNHWYGVTDKSEFNIFNWSKIYIDPELYLNNILVYFNACFGLHPKYILSRSKSYYQNIINIELSTLNPEATHFLERLWFYLFNCHKIK